jgi:HEAT repeat protein
MATPKPNIAVLVEQMPDTDKQMQAKQPAADATEQQKKKPQPDRFGDASKFTGPEPEAAEKVFVEILAGGRKSLLELIGLVHDPSDPDFKNYKAAYVLHGLAIYVGRPGQERQRQMLVDVLAAQLNNDQLSTATRSFFIRELQVAGGKGVVKTLGKYLADDELCESATQALIAIGEGASTPLRSALRGAKGKNRVTLMQALGVLRDQDSLSALKSALSDTNDDTRLAAAWALANIGVASAADGLIKMADAAAGWERIQATNACLLLAEKLQAAGKRSDAVGVYTHLRNTRKDSDRYVSEAAEQALRAPVL